jgi:hypothetical protein
MKRKHWWAFGILQMAGALATAEALFLQFPTLLILSFLLLLPGSLASLPLLKPSQFGNNWSPETLCLIVVVINVALFSAGSFLLVRHRKPD